MSRLDGRRNLPKCQTNLNIAEVSISVANDLLPIDRRDLPDEADVRCSWVCSDPGAAKEVVKDSRSGSR